MRGCAARTRPTEKKKKRKEQNERDPWFSSDAVTYRRNEALIFFSFMLTSHCFSVLWRTSPRGAGVTLVLSSSGVCLQQHRVIAPWSWTLNFMTVTYPRYMTKRMRDSHHSMKFSPYVPSAPP